MLLLFMVTKLIIRSILKMLYYITYICLYYVWKTISSPGSKGMGDDVDGKAKEAGY